MTESWHGRSHADVLTGLGSHATLGLRAADAARRLEVDGPNELRRGEGVSSLAILAGQFRSIVIWVLVGAAVVSVFLGETIDGVAILAIVLLNAASASCRSTAPSGQSRRSPGSRPPRPASCATGVPSSSRRPTSCVATCSCSKAGTWSRRTRA